jgi:hypothetical protein
MHVRRPTDKRGDKELSCLVRTDDGQTASRQRAGLEVPHRDVQVWPAHSSSIKPSPLEGLQPPGIFFLERAELGDRVSVMEGCGVVDEGGEADGVGVGVAV